ncbi:MAG: RNA polymerase sigma factor [bacterium]
MFDRGQLDDLYRYACTLCLDDTLAFDLLQGSLEKYVKLSATRGAVENEAAYLRRMIYNRFIDQVRREQRFPHVPIQESDVPVGVELPDPEAVMVQFQSVYNMLADLQPDERELVQMWVIDEYTAAEIAEYLNCPRGTVLSRIHRLKAKLQSNQQSPAAEEA